jgi:serine/threonine protein kinase
MTYLLDPPVDGILESNFRFNDVIGSGANARVFKERIGNHFYAVKMYNDPAKCNEAKLRAMLKNAPNIYGQYSSIDYPLFGWILGLIIDKRTNRSIGFVMPLVDDKKSKTLDYFYDAILVKKLNSKESQALSFKVEILANLCSAINDLHNTGHKFVDLKPQNLRVFEGTNIVSLIDCDGYTIVDNETNNEYRADMVSTDYIAPEIAKFDLKKDAIPKSQDEYALAVIIFQMLNRGVHPFQGILKSGNILATTNDEKASLGLYPYGRIKSDKINPLPLSIHELMLDDTRDLFDRAFTSLDRPSAEEWAKHLKDILENKRIIRCQSQPNEIAHMRFQGKECPTCRKIPAQVAPLVKQTRAQLASGSVAPKKHSNNNFSRDALAFFVLLALFVIPLILIFKGYESSPVNSTPTITTNNSPSDSQNAHNTLDSKRYEVEVFVCNTTNQTASFAISYSERGTQKISAWYNIVPRQDCLYIGTYNRENLYWYAFSKASREWRGLQDGPSWCVDLTNAFTASAEKNCKKEQVKKIFNKLTTDRLVYHINLRL